MTQYPEGLWWKKLKEEDLLELSFLLAQKALPAWNNFNHCAKIKKELRSLPENSLKEIEAMIKGFQNSQKLNEHFNSFITPVIHIRDGYLKYPHEVKLAFLSVFHILHGLISTDVVSAKQAFSSAVSKAIDSIKIAGILTAEEISMLTHKYYLLSME
ncbi:MAG: hypothetical protein ABI366_01800 [Ginsengibacter sp.]